MIKFPLQSSVNYFLEFHNFKEMIIVLLSLIVLGCGNNIKPQEAMYRSQDLKYNLLFDNGRVHINTPKGSLIKTFESGKNVLKIMYSKSMYLDTVIHMYKVNGDAGLLCKECAKYSLSSIWVKFDR